MSVETPLFFVMHGPDVAHNKLCIQLHGSLGEAEDMVAELPIGRHWRIMEYATTHNIRIDSGVIA